ncbi:hypothetical protein RDI58_018154 [Solanum bulbocastanum]|uniref:AMP-dependent synthetase/ligase domain-containing protein n=1 Tax=Solanum bulbocastanum TaxID=147425 RepID=A0AAN8TDN4_SOLBU
MTILMLTSSNVALRSFNDLNRSVQLHGRTQRVQLRCKLAGDIETDESRRLLEGVVTSSANYVPLTPISFLERAANVFGDTTSVATLALNVPAMQELHFAVPMAEAVLCTLNTRLDSSMVAELLKHSEAKIIFVDQQLLQVAQQALSLLSKDKIRLQLLC